MINLSRALTICAVLITATPATGMEKEEFSQGLKYPTIQSISIPEKENISTHLENQPHVSSEREMNSSEEAVNKILSMNRRRKSSESPRMKIIISPRSTSPIKARAYIDNKKKVNEGQSTESVSISPDEKKELAECLSMVPLERREKPVRAGCKRYSLVGPIEFLRVTFPDSSQTEQKASLQREEMILPMKELKDQL